MFCFAHQGPWFRLKCSGTYRASGSDGTDTGLFRLGAVLSNSQLNSLLFVTNCSMADYPASSTQATQCSNSAQRTCNINETCCSIHPYWSFRILQLWLTLIVDRLQRHAISHGSRHNATRHVRPAQHDRIKLFLLNPLLLLMLFPPHRQVLTQFVCSCTMS